MIEWLEMHLTTENNITLDIFLNGPQHRSDNPFEIPPMQLIMQAPSAVLVATYETYYLTASPSRLFPEFPKSKLSGPINPVPVSHS